MATSNRVRRIAKELGDIQSDAHSKIQAEPVGDLILSITDRWYSRVITDYCRLMEAMSHISRHHSKALRIPHTLEVLSSLTLDYHTTILSDLLS
jgi:iron-sulfur cluster repair protein YtfE (RIC family)